MAEFKIKHGTCCSRPEEKEYTIEGETIEDALKKYIKRKFSPGDFCWVVVEINGRWRAFDLMAVRQTTYHVDEITRPVHAISGEDKFLTDEVVKKERA